MSDGSHLYLQTGKLKIEVSKDTGAVRFLEPGGETILGEEPRKERTNDLTELARKACRWGLDNDAALRAADPEIPEGLSDRAADNVRFLLAIADIARGEWPKRARRAVEICSAESVENEDETAIIRDLVIVFKEHAAGKFRSADLVRELIKLDPRRYRNLTPNAMARLLDPFDIRPKALRIGDRTPRGYECAQFDDATQRYAISLDDALTPPCATNRNNRNAAATSSRGRVSDGAATGRGNYAHDHARDRERGWGADILRPRCLD